jgi:parallel beta-helix repeat protein
MKKLALLIGLFAFLILAGTARADNVWTCNSCVDCNSYLENTINDIIQLTQNITSSGSCIGFTLAGTGNTFDCQGYTITGTGSGGIAILISEQDSKIKNCNINGSFAYGIYDDGNTGVLIDNVRINNASTAGIYLSGNNAIMNNSVLWGNAIGINISSTGNTFYNNMLNNTVNYYNTTSSSNNWNTTITNGTNIVGGSQIGGNYWANPSGTGYSQTCTNANNDSFCDSAYSFNPTDYLPLTLNSPKTYTCNSCASCTANISASSAGDTILVTSNFTSYEEFDICVDTKAGIIFDCQGYWIDDGFMTLFGIWLHSNSVTVRNCNFRNFQIAGLPIYVEGYNNTLDNIYTADNGNGVSGAGIYIAASNSTFNNIRSTNNDYGIWLRSSPGNIISNSTIWGNTYGIFVDVSISNNTFYNNFLNNTVNYRNTTSTGTNYWNTTITTGTNIIGGSQIGGNYWAYPNGTGYSETCNVTVIDGICDDSFSLDGSNTDYLPLSFASAPAPPLPAELSGMALTLSDAGTGLGGFLGAITDPIVGFVLLLGIVSGMFMIFYGLAKAITFTLSQVAG